MLNKIMPKSMKGVKRKVGRPRTLDATEFVGLRLPAALLKRIEDWARAGKVHGRSQAVRALIEKSILVLLPRRKQPGDPDLSKAVEFAQRLLDASIAVVAAACVQPDQQGARDPRIVALSLLCRSISNFRAAMRLLQQEQAVEARALVRLLYENLLWLGSLRERGAEFVQEMIGEEQHNRKALAKLTLELTGKHGGDVSSPDAVQLRDIVKSFDQLPKGKRLHAARIASEGVIEVAYIEYKRFSLDSIHCSVTALGRHLSRERSQNGDQLTLSVVPNSSSKELLDTVFHACNALFGVAVAANEIVGFTSASETLASLYGEFERNKWIR
jgi:hypothetical protein